LFRQQLISWRRALAYIEELDPIDTFSSAFSRWLELEWRGIINPASVPDYGLTQIDESLVLIRRISPAPLNQHASPSCAAAPPRTCVGARCRT
jgi:hypothetical protein